MFLHFHLLSPWDNLSTLCIEMNSRTQFYRPKVLMSKSTKERIFLNLHSHSYHHWIFLLEKVPRKKSRFDHVDNRISIVGNSDTFENIGELSNSEDDMTNNLPTVDKHKNPLMTKIVKYVIISFLYFFIWFAAIVIPELNVVIIFIR